MPTPFWHRIGVWQWIEFVAAIAVLFSAILAVADKLAGAIWGSSWGAILLAAKYVQTIPLTRIAPSVNPSDR